MWTVKTDPICADVQTAVTVVFARGTCNFVGFGMPLAAD